jgi:hypothetical protein
VFIWTESFNPEEEKVAEISEKKRSPYQPYSTTGCRKPEEIQPIYPHSEKATLE